MNNDFGLHLKRMMLGTAAGHLLLATRSKFNLLSTAIRHPERVGTVANDQIAGALLPMLCRPGMTFIDVGAHIGSVVADVIRHDKSINIIAFEAIPEKAAALCRKFPGVTIHECAAGDHEGDVSFFINQKKSGYSSLGRPSNADELQKITVPMRRLDDLISADNIDAIKIDVEGAELGVLIGAKRIIEQNQPVIMFESGPGDNGLGYTKEAMWDFFDGIGYSIHMPSRVAHDDIGLSKSGFIDGHVYPRRCTNYFAIPVERRDEIRDCARKLK